MYFKSKPTCFTIAILNSIGPLAHAEEREFVSYIIDANATLVSDVRARGISNSLFKPGLSLDIELAHESGFVGIVKMVSVSKKQFQDGKGVGMTFGTGYRFGDPDAWHFGVGVAAEIFPDANYTAPHGIEYMFISPENVIPVPVDERKTNYNSRFLVLEVNYGALEGRILNVISSTYRGADTGGVCGTILNYNYNTGRDITPALDCYNRGDEDSRGTMLYDLDYTIKIAPETKLRLHAGYQDIANFSEADIVDYGIGVTHKQWGFEWAIDYLFTRTEARELYQVDDDGDWRETDDNRLVLSVNYDFRYP
jgi:hypothetical protein